MLLRDLITVRPRYARSINIERDSASASALDGYIVTATAQRTLARITAALGNEFSQRAWTITGSYGSGKSAFALFLANLLGFPGHDSVRR
jgi:K+-transporting ATPase c subunit